MTWLFDGFDSTAATPARDDPALVDAETGTVIRYGALDDLVIAAVGRLSAGRGLLLLLAENTLPSLVMYLACLRARVPVVLMDAKADQHRAAFLAQFGFLYVHDPRTDRLDITPEGAARDLHPDLALLLSTSGSTGARKFVRLSRRNLESNATAIATYLDLTPVDRAPTLLPMSYVYGLSVINAHLVAGGSLMVGQGSVMEPAFWDAFDAHGCTSYAGVPQTFTLLDQTGLMDRPKPSLRYVTQAGGRLAPARVLDIAARGAREGWKFFVMYGQTEAAARMSYLPPDLAARHPDSIGRAIPGGSLTIVDADGHDVPQGQEGEILYRGPNVMMGYAESDADLARGAELDALRTGDLGYQDANGLTFITGRSSRFIKISGKRIALDAVEVYLADHGLQGMVTGRDDTLGLVMLAGTDIAPLVPAVAALLDIPQSAVRVATVDALPVNQNGKLDARAALAIIDQSIQAQAAHDADADDLDPDAREARTIAAFQRQFPKAQIDRTTSFRSLGGTSNDFVDMELALETIQPALPPNWQMLSIADLAAIGSSGAGTPAGSLRTSYDQLSARALVSILVVLYHTIGDAPTNGLRLPDGSPVQIVNDMLFYVRMPMFAFLAGMTFYLLDTARQPPLRFARNFALSVILPTYLTIVVFALFSAVVGADAFALRGAGDVLRLFVFPYAHFWFIQALIVMLIGAYLLQRALPEHAWIVMAACALVLPVTTFTSRLDLWAVNSALALLPYFATGFIFARFIDPAIRYRRVILIAAGAVAVAGFAYALTLWLQTGDTTDRRSVFGLVYGVALVLVFMALSRGIPFLRLLAPYTFYIFLWHVFFTSATRRVLQGIGIDDLALNIGAGVLAGVVGPVIACLILSRIPVTRRMIMGQT